MNDLSQNASAFNCELIAFKKFDMGRAHLRGFHGNNSIIADDSCLTKDRISIF